jgi:hypothetical protein
VQERRPSARSKKRRSAIKRRRRTKRGTTARGSRLPRSSVRVHWQRWVLQVSPR